MKIIFCLPWEYRNSYQIAKGVTVNDLGGSRCPDRKTAMDTFDGSLTWTQSHRQTPEKPVHVKDPPVKANCIFA